MKEQRHVGHLLVLAFALAASSAAGMTAPAVPINRCAVQNGERLPLASGGPEALCAAIEQAAIARGMSGAYTVRIVVGSRSLLTAEVTLSDGRTLPPVTMAEMDRPIGGSTLRRFGEAVANHVAGARR